MSKEAVFQEKLEMGKQGEDVVYQWLKENNHYVEDNRRQNYEDGGGPRLLGQKGMLVLPDFTVYNDPGKSFAVEVKVKTRVYLIDGKYHFTVDSKYTDYIRVTLLKKLDYLAFIFLYKDKMYLYKYTDLFGTHQYDNEYSKGLTYLFEFDKTRVVS